MAAIDALIDSSDHILSGETDSNGNGADGNGSLALATAGEYATGTFLYPPHAPLVELVFSHLDTGGAGLGGTGTNPAPVF